MLGLSLPFGFLSSGASLSSNSIFLIICLTLDLSVNVLELFPNPSSSNTDFLFLEPDDGEDDDVPELVVPKGRV